MVTDIAFWGIIAPFISANFASNLANPINIQEHAINYILLLIDLFVNNIPLRLMHFVYPIGYGLVYTLFTVMLWAAGVTPSVYGVLTDWGNYPGIAALVTLILSFIVSPLFHVLWHFWLYHLRAGIAKRCCDIDNTKRHQQVIDDNVEMHISQA